MMNFLIASGYSSFAAFLYSCGDYKGAIENYNLAIQLNSEDATVNKAFFESRK